MTVYASAGACSPSSVRDNGCPLHWRHQLYVLCLVQLTLATVSRAFHTCEPHASLAIKLKSVIIHPHLLRVLQLRMMCQLQNFLSVEVLPPYVPSQEEKDNPALYAANIRKLIVRAGLVVQLQNPLHNMACNALQYTHTAVESIV